MCHYVCVMMHVKDLQLSVVRVGHRVPLAGFCLSLYDLHALNGDVNMIQSINQHYTPRSPIGACVRACVRVCVCVSSFQFFFYPSQLFFVLFINRIEKYIAFLSCLALSSCALNYSFFFIFPIYLFFFYQSRRFNSLLIIQNIFSLLYCKTIYRCLFIFLDCLFVLFTFLSLLFHFSNLLCSLLMFCVFDPEFILYMVSTLYSSCVAK